MRHLLGSQVTCNPPSSGRRRARARMQLMQEEMLPHEHPGSPANEQQLRLADIERLPRGSLKNLHDPQEPAEVHIGLQIHLCVVSVLCRRDHLARHPHPKPLSLQETQECLRHKEVQLRRERAALPHPSCVGEEARDKAIDDGTSSSALKQQLHPLKEPSPHPHGLHDSKQKLPRNGIIGLVKVQEHSHSLTAGGQRRRQQLRKQDVLADVPVWQEAGLLWLDDGALDCPKPCSHDLGQDPVVAVEEGDRTVVAGLLPGPLLVQGGDKAIQEAQRELLLPPHGGVEASQHWHHCIRALAPHIHRQAVKARGLARRRVLEGAADLRCCHLGVAQDSGCLGVEDQASGPHGLQHLSGGGGIGSGSGAHLAPVVPHQLRHGAPASDKAAGGGAQRHHVTRAGRLKGAQGRCDGGGRPLPLMNAGATLLPFN